MTNLLMYILLAFHEQDPRLAEALHLAHAYLDPQLKQNSEVTVQEQVSASPLGYHVIFKRYYRGLEIHESNPPSIHFDTQLQPMGARSTGVKLSAFPTHRALSAHHLEALLQQVNQQATSAYACTQQKRYYQTRGKDIAPLTRLVLESDKGDLLWVNVDTRSMNIANRFNPILSANGEGYVWPHNTVAAERMDSSCAELVQVPLDHLDGSGYLRGAYADLTQDLFYFPDSLSRRGFHYQPGMAFEPSGNYLYAPDDLRFAEVSIYYWINSAQLYLQARGYHIFERPISARAHYREGSNASFNLYTKGLSFDDGFIDSAQDADVIVHEYGHAILDEIVGEKLYDDYGTMFHEGFADFFSYLVSQASADDVGVDRYPEYMAEAFGAFQPMLPSYLRSLLRPAFKFPELKQEPHADGQLWSSAFFELSEVLGRETASALLFQSLYHLRSARPDQVAQTLFAVDRDYFQGAFRGTIEKVLSDRGLIGAEASNMVELSVGQTLEFAPGKTLIRFQAPASATALSLGCSVAVDSFSLLLAKDRVPTAYDYDKSYAYVHIPVQLPITEHTRVPLEPGAFYFLSLNAIGTVQMSLSELPPAPVTVLEPEVPQPFAITQTTASSFKLTGLAGKSRIRLSLSTASQGWAYLFLSPNTPFELEDHNLEGVHGEYVREGGTWILNLDELFPGEDELFLTLDDSYVSRDEVIEGTVLWAPVPDRVGPTRLGVNQSHHLVLGDPWENSWTFELNEPATALRIRTDATHPFRLSVPDFSFSSVPDAVSTLQNQVHTTLATPDYWAVFSRIDLLTPFQTGPGIYTVHLTGQKGDELVLDIQTLAAPLALPLTANQPERRTIAPKELVHYQFNLPADAQAFLLHQSAMATGQKLEIALHETQPFNLRRLPWYGEFNETDLYYREAYEVVPVDDQYRQDSHFAPGADYTLWLYNPGDQPVPLDLSLSFDTSPRVDAYLADGEVVSLGHQGTQGLDGSRDYTASYLVAAPPGTKRVDFKFEHLSGSRSVVVKVYGLDDRIYATLLNQMEVDAYELRTSPDQPFWITFNYNTILPEPGAEKPIFKVHVTYASDSPHNAVLSPERSRIQGGLVSGTATNVLKWPTQLDIPPDTRQVDLAWIATDHAIDAAVRFTADAGLEVPSDLGLINTTLSGSRMDFRIAAETPFSSIPDEHWVIAQYMAPTVKYFVGYDENAKPFRFELAARYRDHQAQMALQVPSSLGEAEVAAARHRFFNPGLERRELLINTNEGQQTVTLPAGGFVTLENPPGANLTLSSAGDILAFQSLSGPGYVTSAATAAFTESNLLVPHVSPDRSDWTAYLSVVQPSATGLTLTLPDQTGTPFAQGLTQIENPNPIASWRKLATHAREGEVFGELDMSAIEYWQNGQQVVAEFPSDKGSRTYFVPHLPDNPAWWSGLTLANLSKNTAEVTVRAYGSQGAIAQVFTTHLEPGASKVGLMDTFLPEGETATALVWLRIDATEELLAMSFMGGIHAGDSAGFALPGRDGLDLVLPGSLVVGHHGIAIVNTVAQSGEFVLEALDTAGRVLVRQTHVVSPYQRVLLTDNMFGLPAGQEYLLRVTTENVRLVGLQLDIDDQGRLATTAGQVIR